MGKGENIEMCVSLSDVDVDVSGADKPQRLKMKRIRSVETLVAKCGKVKTNELVAKVCYELGMKGDTVLEYLRELESLKKIRRQNGFIVWVGDQDEKLKQAIDESLSDLPQLEAD